MAKTVWTRAMTIMPLIILSLRKNEKKEYLTSVHTTRLGGGLLANGWEMNSNIAALPP